MSTQRESRSPSRVQSREVIIFTIVWISFRQLRIMRSISKSRDLSFRIFGPYSIYLNLYKPSNSKIISSQSIIRSLMHRDTLRINIFNSSLLSSKYTKNRMDLSIYWKQLLYFSSKGGITCLPRNRGNWI